jgi:hypothetical protein
MDETWYPVVGWEGIYEVSDLGTIRSVDRILESKSRWGGTKHVAFRGRLITPIYISRAQRNGYYGVMLAHNNRRNRVLIHQVVMRAFVGEPPVGKEVNHRNGDKSDNRLVNLEYVTKSENCQHRFNVLGHHGSQRGEKSWNAKLTEIQVHDIRERYAAGCITQQEIADTYGVTASLISMIVNRKSWSHI